MVGIDVNLEEISERNLKNPTTAEQQRSTTVSSNLDISRFKLRLIKLVHNGLRSIGGFVAKTDEFFPLEYQKRYSAKL